MSEALQAHMWPQMKLKESRHAGRAGLTRNGVDVSRTGDSDGGIDEHRTRDLSSDSATNSTGVQPRVDQSNDCASDAPSTSVSLPPNAARVTSSGDQTDSSSASSQARLDSLLGASDMELLEKGLGDAGDDGVEDFETLFAKFAEMKGKPHESHACMCPYMAYSPQ